MRCSDNSCGDSSWCGYQEESEVDEIEQDNDDTEPDAVWDNDPHGK